MYSIAKIHYTTITMNKVGAARFVKKKKNYVLAIVRFSDFSGRGLPLTLTLYGIRCITSDLY